MSQANLASANSGVQPKTHSNQQSVPTAHTSPSNQGTNQHTPPSQPPLESTPEGVEDKSSDDDETSKQPKPANRRREGTMNKSFKFPPDPAPSESAPPVPDVPKDPPITIQESKPRVEDKREKRSKDSDEVAMAVPPSVEILPPPPIEKEGMVSSVSDLDDVGETEEISLN